MAEGYEDHILVLEDSELPTETIDVASDAIALAAALHGLYVSSGVLNGDAPIDCGVLENLIDAHHGELAAAAIMLSEDAFKTLPKLFRGTAKAMESMDPVVPTTIRKGFERFAGRIEAAQKQRVSAFEALKAQEKG